MTTFGELEDGEIFDMHGKRYIKCLEMAGNGNAVNFDNSRQCILVPAHIEVVRSPVKEISDYKTRADQVLLSRSFQNK